MTSFDAVCVGEVLVDFIPDSEGRGFVARPGGAPANVAAALASLGRDSALISAVGQDWLGDEILHALDESGVDVSLMTRDRARATAIAVVKPEQFRGPDFNIYRGDTADAEMTLTPAAAAAVGSARVVHVSSLLPASGAGAAMAQAVCELVEGSPALLSYDVNLRPTAWAHPGAMSRWTRQLLRAARLIKVTEAELSLLGMTIGADTVAENTVWLVTDGGSAARLVAAGIDVRHPVRPVPVVDATGAGDASLATLIDTMLSEELTPATMTRDFAAMALERCTRVATHVVQQPGAISSLAAFRL